MPHPASAPFGPPRRTVVLPGRLSRPGRTGGLDGQDGIGTSSRPVRTAALNGYVGAVVERAEGWDGGVVGSGAVEHLNPASGWGPWPRAEESPRELDTL